MPHEQRLQAVDGLRAIAVVAVVLFHAYPAAAPAGYLGVDVFFAISGFVIQLRYGRQLAAGVVDARTFFLRRVRRLLPAYAVVVAVTTAAAFALLQPQHLKEFGQGLLYQGVYLQNIGFLLQGDYFSEPTTKPLLHTWSLAVEEQFYSVFPLMIAAISRRPRWSVAWLAAILLGSLAGQMLLDSVSARSAFYLMPARVWQFAAGMLAATGFARVRPAGAAATSWRRAAGVAGLAMILVSFFGLPSELGRVAPSILAVAGACLVMRWQTELPTAVSAVLRQAVIQHLGRISYSWYLWHWPIIVFAVQVHGGYPSPPTMMILVAAGYGAALVSYLVVERSMTSRQRTARWRVAGAALAGFTLLSLGVGGAIWSGDGALWRFPESSRPYHIAATAKIAGPRCSTLNRIRDRDFASCRQGSDGRPGGVLVIGDSYSNMIRHALTETARERHIPLYFSERICRPKAYGPEVCQSGYWRKLHRDIQKRQVRSVVLAVYWPDGYRPHDIAASISRLRGYGVEVWVLENPPRGAEFDPTSGRVGAPKVRLESGVTWSKQTLQSVRSARAAEGAALAAFAATDPGVHVIRTIEPLCGGGRCPFAVDGVPIYQDEIHLNLFGEALIRKELDRVFAVK